MAGLNNHTNFVQISKNAQLFCCALLKNKKIYLHIQETLTNCGQNFLDQISTKTRNFSGNTEGLSSHEGTKTQRNEGCKEIRKIEE